MYSTNAARINQVKVSLLRQIMGIAPVGAVNMALGELGYEMSLVLREYAAELILRQTPRYTPNAGLPELSEAIAIYHGMHYPVEGVCVTNGAEEALYAALMAFLDPGDKIALIEPSYPAYSTIIGICEAQIVSLPYESDLLTIDWDRWETALASGVKVLLFSNPSNPLGTYFTPTEVDKLAHLCDKYNVLMIADEIYSELYFEQPPVSFAGKLDNLIIITGVSKSLCMSGWRMGWAIGHPSLIGHITKAHQYISTCAGWLPQKVTTYALHQERLHLMHSIRSQMLLSYNIAYKYILSHHPLLHILKPNSTPYMMMQLPSIHPEQAGVLYNDDLEFCRKAAQNGVILVPGRAFGDNCQGWIRMNFALEKIELERGLSLFTQALDFTKN